MFRLGIVMLCKGDNSELILRNLIGYGQENGLQIKILQHFKYMGNH